MSSLSLFGTRHPSELDARGGGASPSGGLLSRASGFSIGVVRCAPWRMALPCTPTREQGTHERRRHDRRGSRAVIFDSPRLVFLFVCLMTVARPTPTSARGFYVPSTTLRLPDAVLSTVHTTAHPTVGSVTLGDYTNRDDGKKYVTVVGNFFTGGLDGRTEYPTFTKYVTALQSRIGSNDLPGNLEFIISLKNGVNPGVATAWSAMDGSDPHASIKIIDDASRALAYAFFDPAVHPSYAVIDHCGRLRYVLPSITSTLNLTDIPEDVSLVQVVATLLTETSSAACSSLSVSSEEEVAPAGERETQTHVPGAAPYTDACVPQFGIARSIEKLTPPSGFNFKKAFATPRDLEFHPATGDLWVADEKTDALTVLRGVWGDGDEGDSGIDPQNPQITHTVHRLDRARYHYMASVASLSFGSSNAGAPLVTCQESENDYQGMKRANRFMGPSLYDTVVVEGDAFAGGWPAGSHVFVNASGEACDPEQDFAEDAVLSTSSQNQNRDTCFMTHIDMLHATPLCVGIGHDPEPSTPFGNVFWVNDGLNQTLVRYDFEKPHGPGSLDHSLANVRRFPEIHLEYVKGIPGHVVVDASTRTVFVADVGGGRIVAVHADSGSFTGDARNDLGGNFTLWSSPEPSFEYSIFGCASHFTFADGFDRPSGLAIHGNVLYVSEFATGNVIALHKTSGVRLNEISTGASKLFGLTIHPTTGALFFADGDDDSSIGFVKRTTKCEDDDSIPNGPSIAYPSQSSSDTGVDYCVDTSATSSFSDNLNQVVHTIGHNDGYLNMTPLGPGYGVSADCLACNSNCDNDMLLMSGFLCHACLPDNCKGGMFDEGVSHGTCANLIGQGYSCVCDEGYWGDHCQYGAVSEASRTRNSVSLLAAFTCLFLSV